MSKEKLLLIYQQELRKKNKNSNIHSFNPQFEDYTIQKQRKFQIERKKQKQLVRLKQCSSHSNRNHSKSHRFKDG